MQACGERRADAQPRHDSHQATLIVRGLFRVCMCTNARRVEVARIISDVLPFTKGADGLRSCHKEGYSTPCRFRMHSRWTGVDQPDHTENSWPRPNRSPTLMVWAGRTRGAGEAQPCPRRAEHVLPIHHIGPPRPGREASSTGTCIHRVPRGNDAQARSFPNQVFTSTRLVILRPVDADLDKRNSLSTLTSFGQSKPMMW